MKNEAISERQATILIIMFIIGSSFLLGSGGPAKQDAWIAVIIAISWPIILFLMFSKILYLYPGKDIFDILQIVMGKFIEKTISLLMIWFAFNLGGGLIFLSTVRNILLLGSETISRLYFPSYMSISLIDLSSMLERLEMLAVINFIVCIFVKAIICLIAVCN